MESPPTTGHAARPDWVVRLFAVPSATWGRRPARTRSGAPEGASQGSGAPGGAPQGFWERLRAVPERTWRRLCFTALSIGAFVGYLLLPTYPIYDSEYYLFWGRQILHGHLPSFTIFDSPTEHPLAIGFGTVLAIFGNVALRLEVLAAVISFLLVAGGLYRLTRVAFTPIVGAVAVLLLLTRFNLEFLAARGYVDLAYCAAIVWAAALEVERPRRGAQVFLLLLIAELIRPDAWLLAGVYWLWWAPSATWSSRVRWALVTIAAPVIWVAIDWIVTGQPLYSLHRTQDTAVALGRTVPLGQVPGTTAHYLTVLLKAPVLAGAIAGLVLSAWLVPRRMVMPAVIALCGIGTFVLISGAGLSVIDRYLLMPTMILLVFCGFALTGWTLLERGWMRRVWALAAAGLAAFGIYDVASTLSVNRIETELGFRNDGQTSLVQVLDHPKVKRALRCGPVSVPDHKLRPDVMLLTGRDASGVIDRNEARYEAEVKHNRTLERRERGPGVAIFALGLAVARYGIVGATDNALDQVPFPGFAPIFRSQYYAAYALCPPARAATASVTASR
jgi:hypothetical protein